MRILLTGAQDCIGQRLLDRWATTDQILAITRGDPRALSTPARSIDPADPAAVAGFAQGCQILIHLADVAHDPACVRSETSWADATTRVLDAARDCGIERAVWLAPRTAGGALSAAEAAAIAHPLPTVLLRPTWMVGPEDPRGGSRALVHWAHDPRPILPFVDIRDITGAVERAMVTGHTRGVYDLATPVEPELALWVRARWGTDRPLPEPSWPPPDDTSIDTSRAIEDLGWWTRSVRKSIEDGLVSFQSGDD